MKLVKNSIFLAIFLVIFSSVTYAANFDVEATPIKNRIIIDEFATFTLNVKNNLDKKDEFRIYSLNFPTWDIRTDPIINPITLELEPGQEGSVDIIVDPLKIKEIGTYQVHVNVRSKVTNTFTPVPLKVSILSTEPLIQGYTPTVVTGVTIPEKIDPREEVLIKISLNNQNIIEYPDLIITLKSNLIQDTITTVLGPKEDKTLELKVKLDPLTEPQVDNLVVSVFKGDRSIINPIVRKIEILEYETQKLLSEQKGILVTKTEYNLISNNNEHEGLIKVETTLISSIFSSTSPKAQTIKENNKRFYIWDVNLENNNMQVTVTKNFLPLVAVIIILLVVGIAYHVLKSPLVMKKEASNVIKSEGGISELTVVLHVKNRSKDKLTDIDITEFIPALVSIGKEVSIGSLQPSKILRHEKKKNTVVKWELDHLDASEERVLSYKIKSRLHILGTFSLPSATASFKLKNKVLTTTSNRLSIEN